MLGAASLRNGSTETELLEMQDGIIYKFSFGVGYESWFILNKFLYTSTHIFHLLFVIRNNRCYIGNHMIPPSPNSQCRRFAYQELWVLYKNRFCIPFSVDFAYRKHSGKKDGPHERRDFSTHISLIRKLRCVEI